MKCSDSSYIVSDIMLTEWYLWNSTRISCSLLLSPLYNTVILLKDLCIKHFALITVLPASFGKIHLGCIFSRGQVCVLVCVCTIVWLSGYRQLRLHWKLYIWLESRKKIECDIWEFSRVLSFITHFHQVPHFPEILICRGKRHEDSQSESECINSLHDYWVLTVAFAVDSECWKY